MMTVSLALAILFCVGSLALSEGKYLINTKFLSPNDVVVLGGSDGSTGETIPINTNNLFSVNHRNRRRGSNTDISQIGVNTGDLSSINVNDIGSIGWNYGPIQEVNFRDNEDNLADPDHADEDIGQIGINNGPIWEYNHDGENDVDADVLEERRGGGRKRGGGSRRRGNRRRRPIEIDEVDPEDVDEEVDDIGQIGVNNGPIREWNFRDTDDIGQIGINNGPIREWNFRDTDDSQNSDGDASDLEERRFRIRGSRRRGFRRGGFRRFRRRGSFRFFNRRPLIVVDEDPFDFDEVLDDIGQIGINNGQITEYNYGRRRRY